MTKLYFKEAAFAVGTLALARSPDEFGVVALGLALAFIATLTFLEAKGVRHDDTLKAQVEKLHGQVQELILKRAGR